MNRAISLLACSLGACTGDAPPADSAVPAACPDDTLAPGEVEVFAEGLEAEGLVGTEGLSFTPDGRLWVGGSAAQGGGFVAEVWPDGRWELVTPVVGSVGLTWWEGRLVVAANDEGGGRIDEIDMDGPVETFTRELPGANFPVPTPWGSLLVSDPSGEQIWEVSPDGSTALWLDGIPSPNGLVFSLDGATLYAANTYELPSDFHRISIADGTAESFEVLTTFDGVATQDGVALDAEDHVYVVNNVPAEIWRISPEGTTELLASGVDWGASMAFGVGEGWDPCSLYVTSLFDDVLFRVGVGVPGATAPGHD